MSRMTSSVAALFRNQLRTQGFCVVKGGDFGMQSDFDKDKEELKVLFRGAANDGPTRQRYYARYLLGPNDTVDTLDLSPGSASYLSSDYQQGADINHEQRGLMRSYAPLPPPVCKSRMLKELIFLDLKLLPFEDIWLNLDRNPIAVGLHLIRMVAHEGRPSVPSPSIPHQDGEPFTCIHLIDRERVQGGVSQVYRNSPVGNVSRAGDLLLEVVLADVLDTLIVWDKGVFHHVTPVEVSDGYLQGTRDVLIVDFTPFEECKYNGSGESGLLREVFMWVCGRCLCNHRRPMPSFGVYKNC